jgi:hypothetical protein
MFAFDLKRDFFFCNQLIINDIYEKFTQTISTNRNQ